MNIIEGLNVSNILECVSDKHRLIVDVAFARPVTSDYARLYVASALSQLEDDIEMEDDLK